MVPCSGIVWGDPPAHLPWTVTNLGLFCNCSYLCVVLGLWDEYYNGRFHRSGISVQCRAENMETEKKRSDGSGVS